MTREERIEHAKRFAPKNAVQEREGLAIGELVTVNADMIKILQEDMESWKSRAEAAEAKLPTQPSLPVEAATQSQIILALRKKIHLTEHHNQFFERCESRWCNPNPPLASGIGLEDLSDPATGQHVGDPFAVAVAIEVEKRMKALAPVEAAGPKICGLCHGKGKRLIAWPIGTRAMLRICGDCDGSGKLNADNTAWVPAPPADTQALYERCKMLLDAKNLWMDRAISAGWKPQVDTIDDPNNPDPGTSPIKVQPPADTATRSMPTFTDASFVDDADIQRPTNATAPSGIALIATERHRQVSEEGMDAAHDDKENECGELAVVACCYALPEQVRGLVPWPWEKRLDKRGKHNRVRQLAIAGALIAAEIDRLNRLVPAPPADTAPKQDRRDDEAAKTVEGEYCTGICGHPGTTGDIGTLDRLKRSAAEGTK